ncbi:mask [Symbiodinium necroappetens]|uniref:Mask protein n=1 Tax=Symbiodinium necroappetens TaxID=1628268 RepID=A0A812SBS7_9DINO|nr:mask [Symbiodinium necroappetens]
MAEPPPDNDVRILNTAGEVKYRVAANAAADIRGLKQHLAPLCGLPRFRLRLLQVGSERVLQDGDKLDSAEFQLVVLPFARPEEPQEVKLADAIQSGDSDTVEQLLQLPRNPDDVLSSLQATPVVLACCFGHAEIVSLLLEAGACCQLPCHGYDCYDAMQLDVVATTPLGAACAAGHLRTVEVLLKAGAPLTSACRDGCFFPYWKRVELWPFDMALNCKQLEVARSLLEEHRRRGAPGPLRCQNDAMTPEYVAVADEDWLRLHLDAGTRFESGALVGAVERGDPKIVRWLLEAGADKDRPRTSGAGMHEAPLPAAVRKGNVEMARLLLDIRANMNAFPFHKDRLRGGSLLIRAISNEDVEMVSLLVEFRADAGQECQEHALSRGYPEIVQILRTSRRPASD